MAGSKADWGHVRVPTSDGSVETALGHISRGRIVMEILVPAVLTGTIVPQFDGTFSAGKRKGSKENWTVGRGERLVLWEE